MRGDWTYYYVARARQTFSHTIGVLALVAVVGVASCSGRAGPRISDWQPGTGGGIAQPDTKRNVPYAFDDATVCLTERGSVVVERVDVVKPTGGLRVNEFSFRPARKGTTYNYIDDPHQRLADVGYPTNGRAVIDQKCVPDGKSAGAGEGATLVGVEVIKPADTTASGGGFTITYRSGKKRLKAYVALGIILCSGKIDEHPECQDHRELRPPWSR